MREITFLSLLAALSISACAESPAPRHPGSKPASTTGDNGIASLESQCDGGTAAACEKLSNLYYKGGPETPKDEKKAFAFATKGCLAGDADVCKHIGFALTTGQGVSKNTDLGIKLLDKGCELGDGDACKILGDQTMEGTGVPKDPAKATALYRKGCDKDSPAACMLLGLSDSTLKPEKQTSLYQHACERDLQLACTLWAINLLAGVGTKQNIGRGTTLLTSACEAKQGMACTLLGLAYRSGKVVKRDVAEATRLFRRGCELGYPRGCKELETAPPQ